MRHGLVPVIAFALAASGCASTPPQSAPIDLARFQTNLPEFGLSEGPDGWYLSRMDGPFGTDAGTAFWRYPLGGGEPVAARFGTDSNEGRDLAWDPVGSRGCFIRRNDIWCAGWDGDGWQEARRLPSPVNSPGYEASPYYAPDGSLYFASIRDGGTGQGDIYRAVESGGEWTVTELGPAINSPTGEWNLTLSPDGSMMVFEASGRATNRTNSGDLYLTCLVDGEWTPARPLSGLNTDDSDLDFRFITARTGTFTTAKVGGDGVLRYAGEEHFTDCP